MNKARRVASGSGSPTFAHPKRGNGDSDAPTARRERLLVVDDDASVAATIRLVLTKYDVTFAQSAVGALARIEAGAAFAVIVCDVVMPGMSGAEFFDHVAALNAGLAKRIVFVSGATGLPDLEEARRRTGACLTKPFDRDALCAAVTAAVQR